MDAKGIIRSIGEEGLTKLVLQICEEGLKLTEESAHRLQQPISTWTMLLDLGNYHPDIVIDIKSVFSMQSYNKSYYKLIFQSRKRDSLIIFHVSVYCSLYLIYSATKNKYCFSSRRTQHATSLEAWGEGSTSHNWDLWSKLSGDFGTSSDHSSSESVSNPLDTCLSSHWRDQQGKVFILRRRPFLGTRRTQWVFARGEDSWLAWRRFIYRWVFVDHLSCLLENN